MYSSGRSVTRCARFGRSIGFVGASRGVGITSTVLGIGARLASRYRDVVGAEFLLSDYSFATHLGVKPLSTLSEVLAAPARIERDLDRHLVHQAPGLRLLFGPRDAVLTRLLDPELLDRILHALAERAEYVVADLPTAMSELYGRMVRHLDHVVVLVEPYDASLEACREVVKRLRSWGLGPTRLSAVIVYERALESSDRRTSDDVRAALGIGVLGAVPSGAPPSELGALAEELIAEVNHLKLRIALVTGRDEVAHRLQELLDDSDPVRFDVTRALDMDEILGQFADGTFDAVLAVQDDRDTAFDDAAVRSASAGERTALIVIGSGAEPPGESEVHDRVRLEHVDAYWLSHTIRAAIEQRRLVARMEREMRDLVSCEADLRKLVAQLLRESRHDPRMV